MKKTLLLAGVACLFSMNATAFEYKPYVGMDYAYDKVDFKKEAKELDDGFNSGIINAGVKMGEYVGLEAFYQKSGERKTHLDVDTFKAKFDAYGLDVYGYMPMGCEGKFNLLGSVGLANYDMKIEASNGKASQDRIGYRVGLGAQYDLTENFAARVMARYNYIGTSNINSMDEVTAGIRYTF